MKYSSEDYLREINKSNDDDIICLSDGMLDIMEQFVMLEGDYREEHNYPYYPEHKSEIVDDVIAMFEAGLLEQMVEDFEEGYICPIEYFHRKTKCAFSNVTATKIWGR